MILDFIPFSRNLMASSIVATAKNSGIDLIVVSWGFRDRDKLSRMGNFTITDTAEELISLFFN